MLKSTHGIAPTYLSDRVVMNFDVNGYDTRGSDMELYLPTLRKEAYRNSFMYMGGKLWTDLPEFVQNSASIEPFKRNYKMHKLLINSWLIQHVCDFLRFVRFCVMKWLFLTFWVVRSVPWRGWIFVSHIAYTILNYVSVSSNLVLRFEFVLNIMFEIQLYMIRIHKYLHLFFFTRWFYTFMSCVSWFIVFHVELLWLRLSIMLYMAGPHAKQPLADE